jgi:hypothetical protein
MAVDPSDISVREAVADVYERKGQYQDASSPLSFVNLQAKSSQI